MNTDIFYKVSTKNKRLNENDNFDDVNVSTSLFTTSTPSKQAINNISDSAYLNNKVMKIHKAVLESDFLPIDDDDVSTQTYTQSTQAGGKYMTETNAIPMNYADSTYSMPPYSETSNSPRNSSSHSSSSSYSSSDSSTSETPKKKSQKRIVKKQAIKKPSKSVPKRKLSTKKQVIKKGSKK